MLPFAQPDAPFRYFDMAGIDDAAHDADDAFEPDRAIAKILRIGRLAFEIAFHFTLCFESTRGKAFEGFLQDRRQWLVTDEQIAVSGDTLVFETGRCAEHVIAIQGTTAHAVFGLLAVLLTLMLTHRCEKIFDEDRIGIIAELDGGAFQLAACFAEQCAQLPMNHDIAREAVDVVDQNNCRTLFAV